MDLIDRRQAIDLICEQTCGFEKLDCIGNRCKIVQAIETMPAAGIGQVSERWLPVIVSGSDEEYTTCCDCVYADDPIEICVIKKCVHAVSCLEECFRPKKGREK